MTLYQAAEEIARRLGSIFLQDEDERRAVQGGTGVTARMMHLFATGAGAQLLEPGRAAGAAEIEPAKSGQSADGHPSMRRQESASGSYSRGYLSGAEQFPATLASVKPRGRRANADKRAPPLILVNPVLADSPEHGGGRNWRMFQVRIHGRGGQGVVSAAEMLSVAAFDEGRHAQAFPSFGSERMGAPVMAFCRIDDREIRLREPVMSPDALIIQDPTLLQQVDVFQGLTRNGYILINSSRGFDELGIGDFVSKFRPEHLRTVPATEIALAHIGRPLPNAALLGAFAAISGELRFDSVAAAIRARFPGRTGEANVAAAREAHDAVATRAVTHDA